MFIAIRNVLGKEFNFEVDGSIVHQVNKVNNHCCKMISFRQTNDKSQLLRYSAIKKRWYTTSQRQKYWVADEQIDSILSALWNAVLKNGA